MKKFLTNFIIILFLLQLTSCNYYRYPQKDYKKSENTFEEIEQSSKSASVLVMGDMIFHKPITNSVKTDEGYDYKDIFEEVSYEIEDADLAITNFEGSVNPERALSSFPLFNFPEETIRDLKAVGFDVISTANNHALDSGVDGLISTINTAKKNNLVNIGTYIDENRELKTLNINGINIGLLSYTDTLNAMGSLVKNKEYLIDSFATNDIKKDIEKLKKKSDFIIVIAHWGNEYQSVPNNREIELNQKLIESGADVVFGSHPHVLQRYEKTEVNGKEVYTVYSMGNALSNQREASLKKMGVETGVMVKFNINKKGNNTYLTNFSLIPTYVNRYRDKIGLKYRIVKLEDYLPDGKFYNLTSDELKEIAKNRYYDAKNILEVKND